MPGPPGLSPLALASTDLLGPAVVLLVCAVVAVAIWAEFSLVRAATRDADAPGPAAKLNCPDCGARVARDASTCTYCGEHLETDG